MERCLDLSRQDIDAIIEIPDEIVQHVEHDRVVYALNLAMNRLTTLIDVNRFQYVQSLDLSNNQLTSIDGIQSLSLLERLNIAQNQLIRLDGLSSLVSLRYLIASENKLTTLERVPPSLCSIDVSHNSITEWPLLNHVVSLESLDLSSNHLQAFSSHRVIQLFPPQLRRLVLAKNPLQECCGLARLGSILHHLELLVLDGTSIAQRIMKEGGSLEFMYVNLFPSIPWRERGVGIRREDFVVPLPIITAVQTAAQRGDDRIVYEFLLTGSVPLQGLNSSSSLSTQEWKRRTNEGMRERDGVSPAHPLPSPSTNLPSKHAESPSLAPIATRPESALVHQVKHLQEQLTSMRKYMNVWIKREQWTRETAVKRIQRWIRHCQALFHLKQRIIHTRQRRQELYRRPYSNHRSTPFVLALRGRIGPIDRAAMRIQQHVRGWLVRVRVRAWRVLDKAARCIQQAWRTFAVQRMDALCTLYLHQTRHSTPRLTTAMARLAIDITQLQRVCVAQEMVITQLQATVQRYENHILRRPITRLQSLWRGYKLRQQMAPQLPQDLLALNRHQPSF